MADKKKKAPSILPGKSPWERRAIKSGKAMTPMQVEMHKAFVSGKGEAKKMAAEGNLHRFSKEKVAKVRNVTTQAGGRWYANTEPVPGSKTKRQLSSGQRDVKQTRINAAFGLGKEIKSNKIWNKKYSVSKGGTAKKTTRVSSAVTTFAKPRTKKK